MLLFFCLTSVAVMAEAGYLGSLNTLGLGTSGGNYGSSSGTLTRPFSVSATSLGGSGSASEGGNSYSFGAISGGGSAGASSSSGTGLASTVGIATVPSGPAVSIPTSFSAHSRFDVVHPGSIVQQSISHVPVVSTQVRPVAVAFVHHGLGHGHGDRVINAY